MKWKVKTVYNGVRCHYAPGKMGRDCRVDNAFTIEVGYHYNGSGPKAFNGSTKWPTVKIEIQFLEGQEKERDTFIEKFKKWFQENYP